MCCFLIICFVLFVKIAERVKLSKTRSESSSSDRPVLGSEISSIGVSVHETQTDMSHNRITRWLIPDRSTAQGPSSQPGDCNKKSYLISFQRIRLKCLVVCQWWITPSALKGASCFSSWNHSERNDWGLVTGDTDESLEILALYHPAFPETKWVRKL